MGILLTLLKCIGIAVVAIAGSMGIVAETHDEVDRDGKKQKVLNRKGRLLLWITVFGAAVALIVQIAEDLNARNADREQQERTREQLSRLDRLLTRFQRVNLQIALNWSNDHPVLGRVVNDIGRRISERLAADPTGQNLGPGFLAAPTQTDGGLEVTEVQFTADFEKIEGVEVPVPLAGTVRQVDFDILLFRRRPEPAEIDPNRGISKSTTSGPDLAIRSDRSREQFPRPHIVYYPAVHVLRAVYEMNIPDDRWWSNDRITSIHDLGHLFLVIRPVRRPTPTNDDADNLANAMRPTWVCLSFDRHSIELTTKDLVESTSRTGDPVYIAELPSAEEIMFGANK